MEIHLDCASKGFFLQEASLEHFSMGNTSTRTHHELSSRIEEALSSLYALVSASDEDHCVFTSSHVEAINHVLFGVYFDLSRKTGKNHFITSEIDEAPQIMGMSRLQEMGALFELCAVDSQGKASLDLIKEAITPRTALISLSMANGLTGVLQPIDEIYKLCQERGIYLHVDASHTAGKIFFSFKEGFCDFLTINGENIGAARGTGLLFVRKDVPLSPLLVGGHEQGGFRSGSYNPALLFSLAKAAEIAQREREELSIEMARLRAFFEEDILRRIPGSSILFRQSRRSPHITAINFPFITGDLLLYYLYRKKVFGSQGGGNLQKISHILKASRIYSQSALSFSLSRTASEEELVRAAQIIEEGVHFLQKTNLSGDL